MLSAERACTLKVKSACVSEYRCSSFTDGEFVSSEELLIAGLRCVFDSVCDPRRIYLLQLSVSRMPRSAFSLKSSTDAIAWAFRQDLTFCSFCIMF